MNKYDQMIAYGKFEEFEKLVRSGEASLEDFCEASSKGLRSGLKVKIGKLQTSAFKSFSSSVTCLFACSHLKKQFSLESLYFVSSCEGVKTPATLRQIKTTHTLHGNHSINNFIYSTGL